MRQSEYAIASLVDSTGRLAVCSELISSCASINKYSLSVESYIGLKEDPEEILLDKFHMQLGIPTKDIEKIKLIDSGQIRYTLASIGTRLINTFVFKFDHPVTMKIHNHKTNPVDFATLDDVIEVFNGSILQLSFCAEKMLTYLKSKRRYALHEVLNPH